MSSTNSQAELSSTDRNILYRERDVFFVLGILLMARSGLRTRTVRMADRLRFSVMTQYSSALHARTHAPPHARTHAHCSVATAGVFLPPDLGSFCPRLGFASNLLLLLIVPKILQRLAYRHE